MEISARISNDANRHHVEVCTAGVARELAVAAKASGRGSAINGGELLMAALATCYCNDLYREAARLDIRIDGCVVIAKACFRGVGLAAESVTYSAKIESRATPDHIELLLSETDRLAEVHNTLRSGCPVRRVAWSEPTP